MILPHIESHRAHRIGWLRASVLGANDGVVSVSSLVVGVAAGGADQTAVVLTGVAGIVAGALSMAAGEYISVQSQADTELADLAREERELAEEPENELAELTGVYLSRGLPPDLARQVAEHLTRTDPLGAHARDELGITEELRARPIQAAVASAGAFAVGAIIPIIAVVLAPADLLGIITSGATLVTLTTLGAGAAYAGGAPVLRGALRVTFWGAIAMGGTAAIGAWMGAAL